MESPKKCNDHYPLVLVTWVDCTTFRGWHTIKESLDFTPDEVETAGFLLEDGPDYLRITSTLSGNKDGNLTLLDAMTIPKSWVTKVEVLGLVSSCGCGEEDPYGRNLCKYNENCGFCEEQVKKEREVEQVPQDADCWDTPTLHGLTEREAQELMKPLVSNTAGGVPLDGERTRLEVKQGDDRLGHQLTFDEHIRRGGTFTNWPPIVEDKKKEEKLLGLMEASLKRKQEGNNA